MTPASRGYGHVPTGLRSDKAARPEPPVFVADRLRNPTNSGSLAKLASLHPPGCHLRRLHSQRMLPCHHRQPPVCGFRLQSRLARWLVTEVLALGCRPFPTVPRAVHHPTSPTQKNPSWLLLFQVRTVPSPPRLCSSPLHSPPRCDDRSEQQYQLQPGRANACLS
jgi:hypothetical protein